MLKQFRQKHWENHKHEYYKPACTDCTILGILHSEELNLQQEKMHFIWVSTYLALKVIGTLFGEGTAILHVHWHPSHVQV